ncbi:MAG: Cellulose-binding domain protein, partial [Myxococcales bacterium]|nr:Cellulose-binding domain protein [Myxococcales bacterium]
GSGASPGGPGPGTGAAGTSGPATGSGGGTGTSAPLAQPVPALRKLTVAEFTNSLHDLLGSSAPVPPELEPDQQLDGFRSVSASVVAVSPTGVSQYETAINGAAQVAFSSAARAATVLSCVPASATDPACPLGQALGAFGRRALRRPLTPADLTRYVGVATDIAQEPGGSILVGLKYAVSAILQSPEFLYRVELGAPSVADGGRNKYTDSEMASRLASLLWVSVPDDALMDAAVSGGLSTSAGVLAQAKRMLASPKAHQSIANFANDLYGLDASSGTPLTTTFKDLAVYPSWTKTLPVAMEQELLMRVDDVAFSGDYLSLYDSPTVFVNNELAKIYGLPPAAMDGFRKATLPAGSPRVGLLGAGAILASNGLPQRSSPTLRGRFVAQQLLCKVVPEPPPNVNLAALDMLPAGSSVKATLEAHRKNAACAACHALMDPVGLGLENFDSVGAYRTSENGVPIDATGVLDGMAFQDEASLGKVLRSHPQAAACFVSKLYEQAQGRELLAVDHPIVDGLSKQFEASGHRADQLLLDIASHDAFRFVEIATK